MIKYITGNIFDADTEAIINTVNCEGFMGKGLAYQFKLRFPEMNKEYVNQCKLGLLRPGNLHVYKENGKFIINFPTKDRWRAPSKIEYIESGLDALIQVLDNKKIKSVAIPPLGCGNGGLGWGDVKKIIEEKLTAIQNDIDILVYEPSADVKANKALAPKLGLEAYLILLIKKALVKATKQKLQCALEIFNLLQDKYNYSFTAGLGYKKLYSFLNLSKQISKYEKYYNLSASDTDKVLNLLYSQIVSKSVEKTLPKLTPLLESSCCVVNSLSTKEELACLKIICDIFKSEKEIDGFSIYDQIDQIRQKQGELEKNIKKETVDKTINLLIDNKICELDMFGKLIVIKY